LCAQLFHQSRLFLKIVWFWAKVVMFVVSFDQI
jgi:hypothetical protein